MPKGMHLVLGLTSLDTSRKKKPKITKKRMEQLVEEHRLYNKKCKQTNTILSGRKKAIKLAEGLQNVDSLSVKVANHDYSYNRSFTIKKK